MIAIGNDYGGPELENSLIRSQLKIAMQTAKVCRSSNYDSGSETWLNPVYIVPGTISQPDFQGYKYGHFSRKEKGLVVMIAVPQSVADGEGITEFIGTSLRDAVKLAATFFTSKGLSFSVLKAEKIILKIEERLSQVA